MDPLRIYAYVEMGLFGLIALAGLIGAFLAMSTREDAFEAGGRQNKMVWTALLFGSAFVVMTRMAFLSWVGMVVIGLYWFDVRPQLKDILNGNYGYGW